MQIPFSQWTDEGTFKLRRHTPPQALQAGDNAVAPQQHQNFMADEQHMIKSSETSSPSRPQA